jgi:hypothetical protein
LSTATADALTRLAKLATSYGQIGRLSDAELVELLVSDGASRLAAHRIVAIERGAAEPSRARRHAMSR